MILIKQAIISSALLLAVAHGQAVLLAARGAKGSPVSLALQGKFYGTDASINKRRSLAYTEFTWKSPTDSDLYT